MEIIPAELNLFENAPIQTSFLSENYVQYNPLTTLDKCSNIQFQITAFQDRYIDLNNVFLKLQLQLIKSDGKIFKTGDADQGFIINNMLHSIFKNVNIEMNGQIVSSSQFYNYKCYLENLLNYQEARAKNLMQIQGYYIDSPGSFDDDGTKNTGAKSRSAKTADSKLIELYGKLQADVFTTNKLLMNGVDIKISLELDKPEFYTMHLKGTDVPVLKISEASLFVKYLNIGPAILVAHHKILQSKNAVYNFKRNVIKHFLIPTGVITQNFENIFNGHLPSRVLIGFVNNEAFNGNYKKNPYNFEHFNLSQIQLNVNGNVVPNQPLVLNPADGLVSKAYYDLHVGMNYNHKDFGIQFDENAFKNGFGFYAFDLTPTKMDNVKNLTDYGILKADIKFSKALVAPTIMLVYAEFNDKFELNANKNIVINY